MPTYIDIDIEGKKTSSGDLLTYKNNDALEQALRFYLVSRRGSFVREPTSAGILDTLLFKPLTDLSPEEKASYLGQIRSKFNRFCDILSFSITPDYENRSWEVIVSWKSLLTQETIETEVILRPDLTPLELLVNYLEITLSGESLYYFILSEQITMPEVKLESNEVGYTWGKYLFSNFSETDPYYTQIIALIG